jgi:hypothetical protein
MFDPCVLHHPRSPRRTFSAVVPFAGVPSTALPVSLSVSPLFTAIDPPSKPHHPSSVLQEKKKEKLMRRRR